MCLFARLAAAHMLAFIAFALAACGSLMPSVELFSGSAKNHTETKPEGYLPVTATVVLEPIKGVPPPIFDQLARKLDAASRPAELALINYAGAEGDYKLQGNLEALAQKNKVKLSYRWEVFNAAGARLGGTSGTLLVFATGPDPWSSLTAPTAQVIADQAISLIIRLAKPGSDPKIEAAAPASIAKGGLSKMEETASTAVQSTLEPEASGGSAVNEASEALRLVNEYRKSHGLSPLTLDRHLNAAALALATDMARHNRISHSGPNGANLDKRLSAAGYRYLLAAENVGAGHKSAAELIGEWQTKQAESQNLLLPDAKQMGIAVTYRSDATSKSFWTLVVAAKS
jgi:uncharacterized protein YkwD